MRSWTDSWRDPTRPGTTDRRVRWRGDGTGRNAQGQILSPGASPHAGSADHECPSPFSCRQERRRRLVSLEHAEGRGRVELGRPGPGTRPVAQPNMALRGGRDIRRLHLFAGRQRQPGRRGSARALRPDDLRDADPVRPARRGTHIRRCRRGGAGRARGRGRAGAPRAESARPGSRATR